MAEEPRYFTVEQANRTLPLVERIVRDILDAYPTFEQRQRTFRRLARRGSDPAHTTDLDALREDIEASADHINGFFEELHHIGCTFKGVENGLVDFPSRYQERTILLCWKLGEESIRFWHEVDAGYAGRQPVTSEMLER